MFLQHNPLGILAGAVAIALTSGIAARVQASPVTMYVATNGAYSRTRLEATNPGTPVSTITRAAQLSQPGDIIEVAPGEYTGSVIIAYASNLVIRGKPGAAKPVLKTTAGEDYALVKITGSNNITFSGFEVNGIGAGPNCAGILIVPRTDTKTGVITTCHDINVNYCKVHDAGGGGIGSNPDDPTRTVGSDYIHITGNEIYNCLSTGKYRGSAISLLLNQDTTHAAGYHSVIQTNIIHDNVNRNQDRDANGNIDLFKHTDGNGIIIDTGGFAGPKTLIQNNLVYRNGGRGIHVFNSSNVTVLNNTVYGNNLDPYIVGGGELTAATANNVLFSNNVVQGNGRAPAFRVGRVYGTNNGAIQIKNTTYTGAGSLPTDDADDRTQTLNALDWNTTLYSETSWGSLFVNLSLGDFHLRVLATRPGLTALQSQTALNRGSSAHGEVASNDIAGVLRQPTAGSPPGGYVDRGVYEQ